MTNLLSLPAAALFTSSVAAPPPQPWEGIVITGVCVLAGLLVLYALFGDDGSDL